MEVRIVEEPNTKREIIRLCDGAFLRPLAGRSNEEEILRRIEKYAIFIAAYVDGNAVGYAALYANDDMTRTAYISMLGVVEEMQGRRIGSALVQHCIDTAKANGMDRIRLEVYSFDTKAIAFYRHWGFEYEGDSTEESFYMARDLG